MYAAIIAVVDASRARLFNLQRETGPEGVRESFTEVADLVNPARRLRPSELFSSSETNREAHHYMDAEFAAAVIAEIDQLTARTNTLKVVLCASPNMLGELRKAFGTLHDRVTITTLPRDLVRFTPAELRAQLTSYNVVPESPQRARFEAR